MLVLEINGKDYRLDPEWTVEAWIALHKFNMQDDFLWAQIISLATGAPLELCAALEYEIKKEAIIVISNNMYPTWSQLKTKIDRFELIDFDKLTIGQFIDLEVALGRGVSKNLDWMLSVLYNCEKTDCLKWNYEWAYAALQTWYVKRKELLESFEDLFDQSEDGDNSGPQVDPAHGWYDLIMVLANEEFSHIERVVERPAIEALNFLAWKKDQARKAQLEQKKQQMLR